MKRKEFKQLLRLAESGKIRFVPVSQKSPNIGIASKADSINNILSEVDGNTKVDSSQLDKFREVTNNRDELYKAYDEMAKDVVIAAALDMYADDAAQMDADGRVIWASSDDDNVTKAVNNILKELDIPDNAWSHIYSLCKYGDLYLETFTKDETKRGINKSTQSVVGGSMSMLTEDSSNYDRITPDYKSINSKLDEIIRVMKSKDEDSGHQFERYIEAVANPSEVYELSKRGNICGFIRTQSGVKSDYRYNANFSTFQFTNNDIYVYGPEKFVHIYIPNSSDRAPEYIDVSGPNDMQTSVEAEFSPTTYKVKSGKSILYDIFKSNQELKLLEDSLLLNRITRSSIIRLLQIEVGDMSKSQVQILLRRYKQIFEQKSGINANDGTYKNYTSPGPMENLVYIPTRQGKGSISSSSLGGDVDVKSIADIEYFNNKRMAGLKIPKQYLAFQEDGGFNGSTSLTKLDSRYARTVKRIQRHYINGITLLVNLFLIDQKLNSYVNRFTIQMVSPSTKEDEERITTLGNRVNAVRDYMTMVRDNIDDEMVQLKIFRNAASTILNDSELSTEIDNYIESLENGDDTKDNDDKDKKDRDRGGDSGPSNISFDMPDIDIDTDSEVPSDSDMDLSSSGEELPTNLDDMDIDLTNNAAVDAELEQ